MEVKQNIQIFTVLPKNTSSFRICKTKTKKRKKNPWEDSTSKQLCIQLHIGKVPLQNRILPWEGSITKKMCIQMHIGKEEVNVDVDASYLYHLLVVFSSGMIKKFSNQKIEICDCDMKFNSFYLGS